MNISSPTPIPALASHASDPARADAWRIAGTRFAVKFVVAHHHFNRMSLEEIAVDWNVPLAAVHAAMAYYYDHKAEIDQSFVDDDEFVRKMKAERGSVLDRLSERPA